jgi:hypothetical protein
MLISEIFNSKSLVGLFDEMLVVCTDIFEKYIRDHVLIKYKNEDKTAMKVFENENDLISLYVSDWNTVHKLSTWLTTAFVCIEYMFSSSIISF